MFDCNPGLLAFGATWPLPTQKCFIDRTAQRVAPLAKGPKIKKRAKFCCQIGHKSRLRFDRSPKIANGGPRDLESRGISGNFLSVLYGEAPWDPRWDPSWDPEAPQAVFCLGQWYVAKRFRISSRNESDFGPAPCFRFGGGAGAGADSAPRDDLRIFSKIGHQRLFGRIFEVSGQIVQTKYWNTSR
jgi:hypothetical protein